MNCPKCHGMGEAVFLEATANSPPAWDIYPCDYPGCRAGHVLYREVELRDEAGVNGA